MAGAKAFWIFLALAAAAALGWFVLWPFIQDIQARNRVSDLISEAEKDGDMPPYRAKLPGEAGQAAVDFGKRTLRRMQPALEHPKYCVREKAIYVVEKITGSTFAFEFMAPPDSPANSAAVSAIKAWYEAHKKDKNVK